MVTTDIVVLAGGRGNRMSSSVPKVLMPIGGVSMLAHVLTAACSVADARVLLVVPPDALAIREAAADFPVQLCEQTEPRGTGHAALQAVPQLQGERTLILFADMPLVSPDTLDELLQYQDRLGRLLLFTAPLEDPAGYGRVVRDQEGYVLRVVEEADANEEEREINEVFTGVIALPTEVLRTELPRLSDDNAQGEIYLTSLVGRLAGDYEHPAVVTAQASQPKSILGVNTLAQLAAAERQYQRMQAEQAMAEGVRLADPSRFDLRGVLSAGKDCFIDANVVLQGDVRLGDGVNIGAGAVLTDVQLGDGVQVRPYSVLSGVRAEGNAVVGPFAYMRAGTELGQNARIGSFVETKETIFGEDAKAGHFCYLGDTVIGPGANIGAGTVACNYDGQEKHITRVGARAFIGSNSSLVAPVVVEEESYVAAGSVITKRVPKAHLGIGRGKQRNVVKKGR